MGASHIVRILLIILIINTSLIANSQIWLTGKVYDSTRMVTIPAVKVMSKKGEITFTDSIGRYGINVGKDDSVSFTYRGKSTNYFPVKQINYPAGFDVSLQIVVQDRYQTLKEVVVVGKSYRQDSLENREQEKFVDSRFTKALVRQITRFNDRDLERFMKLWRPSYELVAFSEEYQFYQYILDASRYFKSGILPKARIEERSF